MEYEPNYHGTVRLRKPKTLQRWIDRGWYQETLDEGYTFAIGCGRFRVGPCVCYKCRKSVNSPLKPLIERYERRVSNI